MPFPRITSGRSPSASDKPPSGGGAVASQRSTPRAAHFCGHADDEALRPRPAASAAMSHRLLPLLFVMLSGSGFVGAKLGLPHAEPFMFLTLRFALAALVLGLIAGLRRSPWPCQARAVLHIALAGLLTAGLFSAGVFYSIACGLPPAVSALIIALHPILVALGAGLLLGERVSARRWLGLLLGLFGVYLVLRQRLPIDPAYPQAALLSLIGLFGMSAGNLYQKARCAQMDIFSGGAIQNLVCAVFMLAGALIAESGEVRWTTDFVIALSWMTLAVSVGAVSLLQVMIHHGEVSRVAGVFYLLPVSAALTASVLFDQGIDASALTGIGVTALGVMLVSLRRWPDWRRGLLGRQFRRFFRAAA